MTDDSTHLANFVNLSLLLDCHAMKTIYDTHKLDHLNKLFGEQIWDALGAFEAHCLCGEHDVAR
jgi:hypothetical protein